MKPPVLGIVVAIALLVAGYLFSVGLSQAPAPSAPEGALNLYASGTYGISFAYPENYLFSEDESGPCAESHTITFIRQEDAVPVVAGGEGPTAITIVICGGEDIESSNEWLLRSESNFHLGDGSYASTSIDGTEAVEYRWSGLYEGETTAFVHDGRLVAVSVTYMSPSDPIRAAYELILGTFTLR